MAQQTAVEWLIVQLPIDVKMELGFELIEQANKMFEEQVKKAYNDAIKAEMEVDYVTKAPTAEQYYTETYNQNK